MIPTTRYILEDAGWRDASPAEFFGYTTEEFERVLANCRKAKQLGKDTNAHRFILWFVDERTKAETERPR